MLLAPTRIAAPGRSYRLCCQAASGSSSRQGRPKPGRPVANVSEEEIAAPTADLAHELAAESGNEEVAFEGAAHDHVQAEDIDASQEAGTHTATTQHHQAAHHGGHQQRTIQGVNPKQLAARLLPENKLVRGGLAAVGVFLMAYTLTVVFKVAKKWTSPKAKRKRNVNKNKLVVETINEYLPQRREQLTSGTVRALKMKSSFSSVEIFRKYLWYVLRERKFDQEVVDDLVYLKAALGLKDEQVAEALKERAQRIYDKYGNVMLDVEGMTKAGIERKATSRALFSKMLYLSECDKLLAQETPTAKSISIRDIFGATTSDVDKLRIVSLYELDLDKLEGQFTEEDAEEGEDDGKEEQ
ncbi:hypothetical protein WJX72_004910 [[Myrmecia] bisecta]|uniref:Armadillo-like repeats domain-containing protein n=1 Tax=[Myrmecia] bisecta TaxID=41462 RepID=A0AAW1PVR4_9CHLO